MNVHPVHLKVTDAQLSDFLQNEHPECNPTCSGLGVPPRGCVLPFALNPNMVIRCLNIAYPSFLQLTSFPLRYVFACRCNTFIPLLLSVPLSSNNYNLFIYSLVNKGWSFFWGEVHFLLLIMRL